MSDRLELSVVDADEALRTARDGAAGLTRAAVLRRALAGGGTVVAGGVLLGGLTGVATSAPSQEQDVEVLNFILGLERLEVAFYAEARRGGGLQDELAEFAEVVEGHERAHVAFLERALGDRADPSPAFELADTASDPSRFVGAAAALEDALVAAYNGQAANLTPGRLRAAARIASVEARHAGWVRAIAGRNPAPDPTGTVRDVDGVRRVLRREDLVR
jgi:hypothetical protein